MTKIDLITGILGAGKTTFLRRYAKYLIDKGERIAILENDFGAVNVDVMMLRDLQSDRCQVEMISGCGDPNCHKRRFRTQLIALGMQHFDHVIIEPSGIFDMDEFFDLLYESPLDKWFSIGSILTIVSADLPDILSEQMEYLLASEAACCGKLILSKQAYIKDSVSQTKNRILQHLNRALTGIQCRRQFSDKEIITKEWEQLKDADFHGITAASYRHESYVKQFQTENISSEVHYFMHIHLPEESILPTISTILKDAGCGHIYRMKGALPLEQGWLKINATPERTETETVANAQAVLIVIGEDINRQQIDSHLLKHNTDSAYISI
ncbi:MAG: GTPase (G3E family) [Oscillospiraceae bacterium]|nr:GTPase (G3E family) [Oscillospiraceae bacterium]